MFLKQPKFPWTIFAVGVRSSMYDPAISDFKLSTFVCGNCADIVTFSQLIKTYWPNRSKFWANEVDTRRISGYIPVMKYVFCQGARSQLFAHTQCRLFSLPTPALSETRSSRKMHVPYHLAIYVITSACGANLLLWLKAKIRYLPHHSDKTELAMLKSEIIKHCFHLSFFCVYLAAPVK